VADSTRNKTLWKWLLASLLVVNLLVFSKVSFRADQLTPIYFLDVGQGDSIFIQTADGHTILIDGGPDQSVLSALSAVIPPWQNTIDLVVSTHPDADHSAGLISVLENYQVNQLWYNGGEHDTLTYRRFLQSLQDLPSPAQIVRSGTTQSWGSDTISVIYPFPDTDITSLPSNDGGVVTRFTTQNFDLLLLADISDKVEKVLLSTDTTLDAEVLKVPHHGSRTSSSFELIEAVRPDLAVISVGASNRYGHPTPDALSRYRSFDIPVLQTDDEGTIELVTDGRYFRRVFH
jgi:competence protein ComEC